MAQRFYPAYRRRRLMVLHLCFYQCKPGTAWRSKGVFQRQLGTDRQHICTSTFLSLYFPLYEILKRGIGPQKKESDQIVGSLYLRICYFSNTVVPSPSSDIK